MGKLNQDLIQVDQGPPGPPGAAGPVTNLISIEGSIVFSATAPFFTPTYDFTTVKGDKWKATGTFTFTNGFAVMEVTLTDFLIDTATKFNVYIEKTDLRSIGGATIPLLLTHAFKMEVLEKSADKIRFGLRGQGGQHDAPIPNSAGVASVVGFGLESMKFSLLIVAQD